MSNDEMLTTVDNPYDPFTQFDDWYAFDSQKGYHSCELLARFARTSDDLTEEENSLEISRAIREIIKTDSQNIFKIATKN